MTQEDKELLLKDLCSRLPYSIKCKVWYNDKTLNIKCTGIDFYTNTVNLDIPEDDNAKVYVDNIKPYLFPLSSITEEQFDDLKNYTGLKWSHNTIELVDWEEGYKTLEFWIEEIPSYELIKVFDWLNKNHFDYRDLIGKGLAIDASGLNIYYGKD